MRFIADFHIHSRFSRATAKNLTPENLDIWAQKKGITILGTGDCTHPLWLSELREKLVEKEQGLYSLRHKTDVPVSGARPVLFMLSGEISCIYKKNGRVRKLHHIVLMPDFEAVDRLNKRLRQIGNISSDGRPILGIDSKHLLEIVLEADDQAYFIPAHIWTPWFSLFGSRSGFDSIEECFEDLTCYIHALETGLSSDPPMNRIVSQLDNYLLVSNSDAHSLPKLGREANLFDTDLSYNGIIDAMSTGNGFEGTVEFFPEEGKYYLDGHRKCNVSLRPEETQRLDNICPVCGAPLTVGVLNRIFSLRDRKRPLLSKKFISILPLHEVISQVIGVGPSSKRVARFYERLLSTLGPELDILMNVSLDDIDAAAGPLLKMAVQRMRKGEVIKKGGYDGKYGTIHLFGESEKDEISGQMSLFDSHS